MKTVLITGANKGIGFAAAKRFLGADYRVILAGRNETRLRSAVQRAGNGAGYVLWDISEIGAADAAICAAEEQFGPIDTFVNNAGIVSDGQCGWGTDGFLNISEQCWDETMAVNLKGTYFSIQAECRYLIRRGIRGHIVNVASEMGFRPSPDPYGISKWGVRAMTLGIAREMAPHGITVNAVAPGETATEILRQTEGEVLPLACPRGRQAAPDEIAESILFLAQSDNAVGAVLLTDGGRSLI